MSPLMVWGLVGVFALVCVGVLWCCLVHGTRCKHGHFPPETCRLCNPPARGEDPLTHHPDFTLTNCAAKHVGDEMVCRLCNIRWDTGAIPPACVLGLARRANG